MSESAFTIESEVPVPAPAIGARGRPSKYPWQNMQPGNSFFVPNGTPKSMYHLANRASKQYGHKYTVRTMDGGVRVWRVE
jgi:hypothetical protein